MNKMYVYYISVFILLAMAILSTLKPSTYANGASAEDWNRHIVWIENYIHGNFTSLREYPPLFHFFMIPFVLRYDGSIKYFQIDLAILVIISMSYFLYKKEGKDAMMLAFFMLSASVVFQVYFFTLTPQVLDYILFPLIVLAYFSKKYLTVTIGLTALMYNHLFGIIFFGIVFIHSLMFNKKYLKYLLIVLILSIPVLYIYYIPTAMYYITSPTVIVGTNITNNFTATGQLWQTGWDVQFTGTWYKFLFFTGLINWILLAITIYLLFRINFKINESQKFYLIWIIAFIPVCLIFNVWRGMSYLIIPLTFFEASIITEMAIDEKERDKKEV